MIGQDKAIWRCLVGLCFCRTPSNRRPRNHFRTKCSQGPAGRALGPTERARREPKVIVRWQCSAPLAEQAALRARVEAVFRDLEAGLATRGAPAPTVAEATSTGAAGDSALGAAPLFGFGLVVGVWAGDPRS